MAGIARRRPLLIAAILALLIAAALALPPFININRYQRQIAASLQAGLGHPVEISGVKLVLLPRPGVEIANFVVDSNPGFSAEPILQCSSVTAGFRLSSLWRGRLEIARISLDEPSLNLERAPDGQWNFASVLLQAARTPQAPTGRSLPLSQKRFPYIEAIHARINLKHGAEKLPLSFLNADIAVWLETPDEWRLRFAAQPARTDINLSLADTGTVQINGSVRRAEATGQLPLDLRVGWRGAPLGQVSRILLGQDLGWRGDAAIDAHLVGTPETVNIEAVLSATDFRRESVMPASPLDLHTSCGATYHQGRGLLDAIHCVSPVGSGQIEASGTVESLHATPVPSLALAIEHVPAAAALEWLRHVRNIGLRNVTVAGAWDGTLRYDPASATAVSQSASPRSHGHPAAPVMPRGPVTGSLLATRLALHGDGFDQTLPDLHVDLLPASPAVLTVGPARFDLGGATPLLADARLTEQDFSLHVSGGARLSALEAVANAFHLAPSLLAGLRGNGTGETNLTVSGPWVAAAESQAAEPPVVLGTLGVHNALLEPPYLTEPIHLATANATFSARDISWTGIVASFGDTDLKGSLRMALPCSTPCVRTFDLISQTVHAGSVAAALRGEDGGVVAELLNAAERLRSSGHSALPPLQGTLHAALLTLGPVSIQNATATLSLEDDRMEISRFDGRTLHGTLHATGTVSLARTPAYKLKWELDQIDATALSSLLGEDWGPGTLDLSGRLVLAGTRATELSSSAAGPVEWAWRNGGLPQPAASTEAPNTSPLAHFDRWSGRGVVAKGQLNVTSSDLITGDASDKVTGSIGLDRTLHLQIAGARTDTAAVKADAASDTLTGTLGAPIVQP